jgi:hypothetical protein
MGANSADLDKLSKIIGIDPDKLSEVAERLSKIAPQCAPPRQMMPWPYLPVTLTTG